MESYHSNDLASSGEGKDFCFYQRREVWCLVCDWLHPFVMVIVLESVDVCEILAWVLFQTVVMVCFLQCYLFLKI